MRDAGKPAPLFRNPRAACRSWFDGSPFRWGVPSSARRLALLLLSATRSSRVTVLSEGLRGERPRLSGQRSLESYVSRLRGLLGAERIQRKAPATGSSSERASDLQRFEALLEEGRALAVPGNAAGA